MAMCAKRELAFGSVATVSYLRQAIAMALSLRKSGDSTTIFILVPDLIDQDTNEIVDASALDDECIQIMRVHDLKDQPPELSKYYFDAFEYSNMLKPFLIMELLHRGFAQVAYLDSDLMFVRSLSDALTEQRIDHVGFTPHLLSPPTAPSSVIEESNLCQSGVLNGGFYVTSKTEKAISIIKWMMNSFPEYGFVDYGEGLFVDQKLLQNAYFHFFPDIQLFLDSGFNIAYWNAHERSVCINSGRFYIDDNPVLFFHLSGMAPGNESIVCRYLDMEKNQFLLNRNPWFKDVYATYSEFWQRASTFVRVDEFEYPFRSLGGIELSSDMRRWIFLNKSTEFGTKQVAFGLMRMLGLRIRKLVRL